MDVVVFGDTGGHYDQLVAGLQEVGVDTVNAVIPDGLMVVHVGDLIHKGPGSEQVVRLVDELMVRNSGRWVQLLGNHEAQHVNPGDGHHFWECNCSPRLVSILQGWWNDGLMRVAWGTDSLVPGSVVGFGDAVNPVPGVNGVLVVHGGLTRLWWDRVVSAPVSAVETARRLNATSYRELNTPGLMLGVPLQGVGPVWAIGNSEVFNSWVAPSDVEPVLLPFHMVHGHTSSVYWGSGVGVGEPDWWDFTSGAFRRVAVWDENRRSVIADLGRGLLVGVDPGFNETADLPVQPHVRFSVSTVF